MLVESDLSETMSKNAFRLQILYLYSVYLYDKKLMRNPKGYRLKVRLLEHLKSAKKEHFKKNRN